MIEGNAASGLHRSPRRLRRGLCVAVVLAIAMTLGLASTALAAEAAQPPTAESIAQPDNFFDFEAEGIPRPIVDSAVEGWYRYLGNGEFVTEAGRHFFWRDGMYVNTDGSVMPIPESCLQHQLSLGIDHQPTAADIEAAAKARALAPEVTDTSESELLSPATWSGRYLHWGGLNRPGFPGGSNL